MNRWSLTTLPALALIAALAPGCGSSCEVRRCSARVSGSSLSSNDQTYNHCLTCSADGACDTELQDDQGVTFFECQDGAGEDCTGAVVDAELAYCEVG